MKFLKNKKRKSLLKEINTDLKKVKLLGNTKYIYPENITISDYSYIANDCYIDGRGGIDIGSYTSIAFGTILFTTNHNYKNNIDMIPYDRYSVVKGIKIGDCCWLGAHSKVLPGVTIEDGAIVAMGAVVTKDVPKCAIVAGNPAKIIGYRDKDIFDKLYKEKKFYHKLKREDGFEINYVTEEELNDIKKRK